MNQNRLNKYNETNEKIVPWTLFIIFLISIPILYYLLKKFDLILQMILIVIKLLFVKYMI